jgi:basic membrane lipoprotein Med (substrate-binding protein (PBP1-ABC) superfamily)
MTRFLKWIGVLSTVAAVGMLFVASPASVQAADHKYKVVVLIGSVANEGSFNQVAIIALKKLAAEGKIEYEVRDRVTDPTASEPVIRLYASRGYDLIIGHGIDLSAPILKVAKDFPKIHFTASAGPDLEGKLLPNVDGWTYDFGQFGYLGGWLAGKIKGVSIVGAVGGPQLPFILATHKGFKAGLASTNPKAKVIEVFTGSFDDAQKALEATRSVAAQGATLIWTSGDGISNGVAAGANQLGLRTIGVFGESGGLAPKVNISSVVLDMYPLYSEWLDEIKMGTFGHHFVVQQLSNRGLVLTPINRIGTGIPTNIAEQQNKLVEELKSGQLKLPNFFE